MWVPDHLSAIYANAALTRACRLATFGLVFIESIVFANDYRHASILGCCATALAGRRCCCYCGRPRLVVLRENGVPVLLKLQTEADYERERLASEQGTHLGDIFVNDRRSTCGLLAPVFEDQSYGISTNLYGVSPAEMPGVMTQLVPLVHPLLATGINDAIATGGAAGWDVHAKVSWMHPVWALNDTAIAGMIAFSFIVPLAVRTRKSLQQQKVDRARANGWCPVCEYDLKGQDVRCPECGQHTPIEPADQAPDLQA